MKKFTYVKIIAGVVLAFVLIFFLFIGIVISGAPALDSVNVRPDGYLTTILDRDGEVMTTLAGAEANRVYADLGQIPQEVQQAFVAIEDERFYKHHGVDMKGVLRAVWKGISSGGHFTEGASTITQQLLKNNVFEEWMEEKSFSDRLTRKIQEQYLAVRLEKQQSKEWILENYLNTINLGGGTWGVQAASVRYFGKNVSELTLSEAAVIAGVTKNPSAYNPIEHPEESAARRSLVLEKMLQLEYIDEAAYDEACSDPVYERIAANAQNQGTEVLSYFEDALVQAVRDDLMASGCTEEKAWDQIYRGGLTICSTQNSRIQDICETEINRDSYYSGDEQASIVILDVNTGAVSAVAGGRGEKTASLVLNRALSSIRQPGSAIKVPGEYAAGLENGSFTLGTTFDDAPCTYADGTAVHNADGTYGGMTTVRRAIASSCNIVALKCFREVGMESTAAQLKRLGITTLTEDDEVEALALGGTHGGVTNMEMTAAYNALAAGGSWQKPYYYTQVLDREGNVLLEHKEERVQAVSAETAALLTSAMEDVLKSGTGTAAMFSGIPLAGKSGTTTDTRDAWFIGYSPYYTCGVWGGFDSGEPQKSSTYVKKLWKAVMSSTHENYKYKDFTVPDTLTSAVICSKCGKLATEGLCDHTEQGDMTCTEYYAAGSEPQEYCICHVEVTLCQESGQSVRFGCPEDEQVTKVYLISGTPGTADEAFVLPESAKEFCSVHTHFWDRWFGKDKKNGVSDEIQFFNDFY